MRIVDAYIKAFYLPWGDELHKWAMTHPEYTQVGRLWTADLHGMMESHMHGWFHKFRTLEAFGVKSAICCLQY